MTRHGDLKPTQIRFRTLKKLLPQRLYWPLRAANMAYQRQRRTWADQRWRDNFQRLTQLHDAHRGERCVIIGNGPSLNHTPLERLKNHTTIGLNRIYLKFDELGFSTDYLVCVNQLVLEQFAQDLVKLPIPHVLNWASRDVAPPGPNTMYVQSATPGGPYSFGVDPRDWICEGYTVTYVAMQLAYYLGFKTVILIGVDHSFTSKGTPNQTVVSQGDDPNHFAGNYFGKGVKWQLPDLEGSEVAYRVAKRMFEDAGREIIDATIQGQLNVFPKADFHQLFPSDTQPPSEPRP